MLHAHRQAWAWMDEWWGLSISDIRSIEKETQEILARKYGGSVAPCADSQVEENDEDEPTEGSSSSDSESGTRRSESASHIFAASKVGVSGSTGNWNRIDPLRDKKAVPDSISVCQETERSTNRLEQCLSPVYESQNKDSCSRSTSKSTLNSYSQGISLSYFFFLLSKFTLASFIVFISFHLLLQLILCIFIVLCSESFIISRFLTILDFF